MASVPLKRGTTLIRGADAPLYRQIYEHIRTAIGSGQLQPGGRLPSTRRLAEEFATARGTVDAAYAMLAGEGYVVARGPAGRSARRRGLLQGKLSPYLIVPEEQAA